LREPNVRQEVKLRAYLKRNYNTAFGKAHRFDSIDSYEEFARRVPLANYESFEPWIARTRRGETKVLTHDAVTRLVPTSGSTTARKLIPFTAGLQQEFNAAIGPWLVDLQRQMPGLVGGPAYWSVTPCFQDSGPEESAVPIGFDTDTAYLGRVRRLLGEAVMAVPSCVQNERTIAAFRYETLFHLLRCRELRLISVWHPSFLMLLLDSLPELWESLLNDMADSHKGLSTSPLRSRELRVIGPQNVASFWPELRLISCWGDGHAEMGIAQLQSRFPGVQIQRKGLLATEGVISIPFSERRPLAVQSHFFEFIEDGGEVRLAHQLRHCGEYEVAVTTAGGLWRYRLGDRIRVTNFVGRTPCVQFLERTGGISDRAGEKLSESFVAGVFHEVMNGQPQPGFALIAPDEDKSGYGYTLYFEGAISSEVAPRFEVLLRRNPHYAWCRELGQLCNLRLFHIKRGGFEAFTARECANGRRLGDIKPRLLSTYSGWSKYFDGNYLDLHPR
jgi:hypothetical protein